MNKSYFLIKGSRLEEIFNGREDLLRELTAAMERTEWGHQAMLALIGPRGIGKTALLMEFQRRNRQQGRIIPLIYVDFERIVSSPEEFSIQYPREILAGYLRFDGRMDFKPEYQDLEGMGQILGLSKINGIISRLKEQLNKDKMGQQKLVEMAFSFPEELATALNKRFLIVIDEFPFLSDLDNFSGMKGAIDLFGKIINTQRHLSYIITGSTNPMNNLLSSNTLYGNFKALSVEAMNPEEGLLLISRVLTQEGIEVDQGLNRTIYDYSFGHPFYMVHIAQRAAKKALPAKRLSEDLVDEAVAEEVLLPTTKTYLFCRYIYELALERARSKSLLKALLHLLVTRDNLSLSEKASLIKRTSGETSSLLQRLMEVDLLTKKEKKYEFRDRLLRLWIRYREEKITTDQDYTLAKKRFIADLKDEVAEAKGEKVFDPEKILKVLKSSFRGQRLPGRLFRRSMDVVFVVANRIIDLITDEGMGILVEGITSSRAIASLSIGQNWMVMIRTGELATASWIERILSLKEKMERDQRVVIDRIWIISEEGFTNDGITLACEKKVLLSDKNDWRELERLL